ncbi:hypothetical protein TNCV_2207131 [Trichonephila clavipes]|uniref:Uncharacterized protein n=1 Tax=Trichonephila clavipes TaxID=2585209 RepID=A0A8X6S0L7_TRICX|nr:hypothetical protein TNCV_2207131 [Trichonephila clavipes]
MTSSHIPPLSMGWWSQCGRAPKVREYIAQIRDMSVLSLSQHNYIKVIKRRREKRPELGSDRWLLHQDSHMALSVRQFLTGKNITMMEHPPYSPDYETFFLPYS